MSMNSSSPLMWATQQKRNADGPLRWTVGAYFRARFLQFWTHSLDEEFDEAIAFPRGTVFLVERAEVRSLSIGADKEALSSAYVILRTLDPRDSSGGATLRLGLWPSGSTAWNGLDIRNGYSLIDEPLVILALAGAGLAL